MNGCQQTIRPATVEVEYQKSSLGLAGEGTTFFREVVGVVLLWQFLSLQLE